MAKKKAAKKKAAPAHAHAPGKGFDVEQLHTDAMARHLKRKSQGQRDPKQHLNPDFDLNVKETYNKSMELINKLPAGDRAAAQEHLESVLSSGPVRYDR